MSSSAPEVVSTTTHEYNNVLMTVINYAKMGLRHKDDATRQKSFEKILNAGNRAAKITNGILGFASKAERVWGILRRKGKFQ